VEEIFNKPLTYSYSGIRSKERTLHLKLLPDVFLVGFQDGRIHQSLSAVEILFLTVAYDWFLFG